MNEETLEKILQRLNILISLELNPFYEKATDRDKIDRLDSLGLKPSEIGEILGVSNDKVSKQLYAIRSKKKGGGK